MSGDAVAVQPVDLLEKNDPKAGFFHRYIANLEPASMLPALAIYGALAAARLNGWLSTRTEGWAKIGTRFAQPFAMLLCVANCLAMMYFVPLVLKEGIVNARTRVAFEKQLAMQMETMPMNAPETSSATTPPAKAMIASPTT